MNIDDFEEMIKGLPKSPIAWLASGMASLQIAFEFQMLQSATLGIWSNFLRTKKCDPVQHIDSLLEAWDCLADVHVQNCAVVLACGCHIANMWDEWAFDPCDEHIKALDGRDPVDFWINETEAGKEHVTHPNTLPVRHHKPRIQGGFQYVHMHKLYQDKHDSLIAERLLRSVDDA